MKPVVASFDSFFPDITPIREALLKAGFSTVVSPVDGITYPGICLDIPKPISSFFVSRLSQILGGEVTCRTMFARVTSKETGVAPHQIHSDVIMGMAAAHVYISPVWPEGSGTSFWRHKIYGERHLDDADAAIVMRDSKDRDKWLPTLSCQGRENRLLIHDAQLWHCAEPVGGWGEGIEDGRIVLTCFFDY